MYRLNVYLVSIMYLVALAVSTARAGPLSPADAVLVLDSPATAAQAMAAPGAPLRCTPGKAVGVWVGGQTPLTVQGLVVEGCAVGIVVSGQGHKVHGARLRGNQIQALAPGDDGAMTDSTLDDGGYGLVLLGNRNQVLRNTILTPAQDGILVVGTGNLLQGNAITDAGRHGINVTSKVGMIGSTGVDFGTQWWARENTITENSVVGSRRFDLRQQPAKCLAPYPPHYGLLNSYSNNHFATKQPWCLQ